MGCCNGKQTSIRVSSSSRAPRSTGLSAGTIKCTSRATTSGACVECEIPQMARNHYFTGKLLVERDFTDEQRYYMGKQRRHNQYLHGWGTVCGLKVKQHPNPACRDQYVVVEEGTAVDCCGREILVPREEYFDFKSRFLSRWQDMKGKNAQPDDQPHRMQLCLRYVECPAEDVPALFDECGCDETACQPNRILESYDLDVLIDRETEVEEPIGVRLDWRCTANVAHAHRVAVDEANDRLYVLTSDDPASLIAFSMDDHSLLRSRSIAGQVMDLALSADGSRVYVSLKDGAGLKVLVLDPDLSSTAINTLTLPGSNGADVRLAVASSGRLYALNSNNGTVYAWDNPDSDGASDRIESGALGDSPRDILLSPDEQVLFVADDTAEAIKVLDATDLGEELVIDPDAIPYALAAVETTGGTRLFVADKDGKTVGVFSFDPSASDPATPLGDPLSLSDTPLEMAVSPGGRWIYVLVEDANGEGYVRVVDAHKVEAKETDVLGPAIDIGDAPHDLALTALGRRLYAAYNGSAAGSGGVAAIDLTEEPCEDLFQRVLDPCPECPDGKCVVLATVEDYVYEDKLVDKTTAGPQNGEAQIDNLKDRPLLPSTNLIADVVQCILEQKTPVTNDGEQGPPGPPGPGIDKVQESFVDWDKPGSADIQMIGGKRTLVLEIPRGRDGVDGADGANGADGLGIDDVEVHFVPCDQPENAEIVQQGNMRILYLEIPTPCATKLTHICAANWDHGKQNSADPLQAQGLIVAFDREVQAEDINRMTFQVLARFSRDDIQAMCWCEVRPEYVGGVELTLGSGENEGTCKIEEIGDHKSSGPVNGAVFLPEPEALYLSGIYRVVLKGDLIRDDEGRGIDADHLPAWLPQRATGDGVEGGTFESWFTTEEFQIDVNVATIDELEAVVGIGPEIARAIVAYRTEYGLFESMNDLIDVPGIGDATLNKLRTLITVGGTRRTLDA
jgi:competence ComEA-like helix-hairpin-helix protein